MAIGPMRGYVIKKKKKKKKKYTPILQMKNRDPLKWYEAYHPKFNLAAAQRLPGGARVTLDPVWSQW